MPAALSLREDFIAPVQRNLAVRSRDAKQSRRLLSIAAVCDGINRGDAARIGGMGCQILCDWVVRFNDRSRTALMTSKARMPNDA